MYNVEVKKYIKILSDKYNVPESEIKVIINSIFDFIKTTIRKETDPLNKKYPSFRIRNFGKFYVPKNKVEYVYKYLTEKK